METYIYIGVAIIVAMVAITASLRRSGGVDPLDTGRSVTTQLDGGPITMRALREREPQARHSAGDGPGGTVDIDGRTWTVRAVYTYVEEGERWQERRVQEGGRDAWLAADEQGQPVLFDRQWETAEFPTSTTATMPDGTSATRVESGAATFTAEGDHDGWASGELSYATYRDDTGRIWSFELHDGEEVETWSGSVARVGGT